MPYAPLSFADTSALTVLPINFSVWLNNAVLLIPSASTKLTRDMRIQVISLASLPAAHIGISLNKTRLVSVFNLTLNAIFPACGPALISVVSMLSIVNSYCPAGSGAYADSPSSESFGTSIAGADVCLLDICFSLLFMC